MSQTTLHFQCSSCHSSLTVPVHLAGITGPCPNCGATVTSPQAPAPELVAVPPMPTMVAVPEPPAMPPPQQPVATIPQPSFLPPPDPLQSVPAQAGWGAPGILPPMPAAAMTPPAMPAAPHGAPEISPGTTSLPPRRQPGQPPAGSSLMNQTGLGGFGPASSGLAGPSASPQWSLPSASQPPPMPERPVEDPMTTILMGTGTQASSELDSDPRHLTPGVPPLTPPGPAPVTLPSASTMNIQLGGRKRGGKTLAALAAVLIIGALGAGAWFFQEPIMELVKPYLPSQSSGEDPSVAGPGSTEPPASEPTPPESPTPPVKTTEPANAPFDPVARPAAGSLPVEQPKPIIVQNPGAAPNPGSPVTIGPPPAGISGSGTPSPAAPEVKPAMPLDKTATSPEPPAAMPPVPKALVVEEPPPGSGTPGPGQPQHLPGTAIGKKGMDGRTEPLVEVDPGKPASDPQSARSATLTTPELTREVVVQATPESKRAAESLKAFFAAKNLAERIPLTLGSENLKSLMERYYARKDSGPVEVDEIKLLRFDPTPDTGGGPHCVFTVSSKLWEYPLPVMLQEEGGSFKVDWLAFVEFRDNLLYEFLSSYQEMPARFHVGIRRTHYFEDDVPNLSEKDCFEIQPPMPTYVGYVFVPKGTPLARDLAGRLSWETLTAYVIVELRWKKLGEMKWVELTAVPQLNWYSYTQVADAEPAPPKASPAQPKSKGKGVDIQKAR